MKRESTPWAVAAHGDLNPRPAGADGAHDVAQHHRHLGAVGRLAGTQDHRHRLAGGRLVDVDGQEAAAVVMGVEQRQLLAAMHPVLGVVDVQQDAPRDLGEAVAEQVHHRHHHALQRRRPRQVLQAADGRLRAQVGAAFRQSPHRHLERRITPERVAVVGVGVTGDDRQGAEPDHLGEAVGDPLGIARILDAAGEALGNPQPPVDLGQQQDPGIRGQLPAVEGNIDRLAADRWKARQNPRNLPHGGCNSVRSWRSCLNTRIIHDFNGLCCIRQPSQAAR